ncbi:MAG: nucleotide exchange factor GrpE [Leptonema sp. (in: bacteria)]
MEERKENQTIEGVEEAKGIETEEQDKETELEKLKKGLEELKMENNNLKQLVEELKENWARERAEFSNYRKRMQQEILFARSQGVEDFIKKLLPIIDNLELVLNVKNENPEVKNFISGVEMIRNEFLKILESLFIKQMVFEGDKFNPQIMEAIDVELRENIDEEIVINVYKKAYIKLDDSDGKKYQVLRLASVKVAKPKPLQKQNTADQSKDNMENTSNQNDNHSI